MSIKIETRFAPSVVRAAATLETVIALTNVPFGSKLSNKAHDSFMNMVDAYKRQVAGFVTLHGQHGYEIEECMKEMAADRKRRSQEAKRRREAHALAREGRIYA
ncbi:hypothetical protein NKH72_22490 [Mesorhizobium sp. M0955]|uniref:hypothetical protein n=1 Tax=Mesorhizobium sp. M0955 TaxID=2957033 RepID=UPI00333BBD97